MTSKPDDKTRFRIAVMISGSGTSLQNLINRIGDGRMPGVEIALVISSRSVVAGVDVARNACLPLEIIRRKDSADVEHFSERIASALDAARVELVVQAGWLCLWRLPERWRGKVINIHPALLPKFGGKGYFGHHVHEAVLAAGETTSGATVHWVNNEYDSGPNIAQAKCDVEPNDTVETLAARVQALERDLLPRVILQIKSGEIPPPADRD